MFTPNITDDEINLAKRAVACEAWEWMSGMTAIPLGFERERWLLCWVQGKEAGGYQTSGGKWWGIANSDTPMDLTEWIPDLSEPATIGCLLDLVRKIWRDHTATIVATKESDGSTGWIMESWNPQSPINQIGPFSTEAETLIAALEVLS